MYSLKPGRGPSLMEAVVSLLMSCAGIVMLIGFNMLLSVFSKQWETASGGGWAPFGIVRFMFSAFIIVFIAWTAVMAIYNFVNFRNRNRMSAVDVTTGAEEPDPIAQAMGYTKPAQDTDAGNEAGKIEGGFCPFCGAKVEEDFEYCPKCGKDI